MFLRECEKPPCVAFPILPILNTNNLSPEKLLVSLNDIYWFGVFGVICLAITFQLNLHFIYVEGVPVYI